MSVGHEGHVAHHHHHQQPSSLAVVAVSIESKCGGTGVLAWLVHTRAPAPLQQCYNIVTIAAAANCCEYVFELIIQY